MRNKNDTREGKGKLEGRGEQDDGVTKGEPMARVTIPQSNSKPSKKLLGRGEAR